ncbi:MAG TPA: hypothetical protein PLD55_14675 [bacterium]|nr:hypothetical protein [bacterium]HQM85920.1 hypothetical protein [bacterium]
MINDRKYTPKDYEDAKQILSLMLKKYPLLNPSGWADKKYYNGCIFAKGSYEAHRQSLVKLQEEFLIAYDWLKGIPVGSEKDELISSYVLKDIAEKNMRHYISNGIFIAAAIHKGFAYKLPKKGDQNLHFMINRKTVNKRKEEADRYINPLLPLSLI